MTIEECYQEMGGNYAEVSVRLPSHGLIEKFVLKFLQDKSFETLCIEMETGNRDGAFWAAHTLKGVCANLSFARLLDSAAQLTEELRTESGPISDTAFSLLEKVRSDYQMTVSAIQRYSEEA